MSLIQEREELTDLAKALQSSVERLSEELAANKSGVDICETLCRIEHYTHEIRKIMSKY